MSEPPPRFSPLGAVLAGGSATRLGGAKATVLLAGRPLLSHPLESLAQAGVEHVVIAKAGSPLPPLEVPVVTEPDEPLHPLAGVIAALRHAGPRGALILPCDAPFISPMLLRVLASAKRPTAVETGGRVHPLIAFYTHESIDRLEAAVAAGDSATDALESVDPEYVKAPERETFNVNTPEDLDEAEELLRRARS